MGVAVTMRHVPSGVWFAQCQLWQFSARPCVTAQVFGPLLVDPVTAGAAQVRPYPVAVPGVDTMAALRTLPPYGATVTDPPPLEDLPCGFLVIADTYQLTGTVGADVPLPSPFDTSFLTFPAITADPADWLSATLPPAYPSIPSIDALLAREGY